MSNNKFKENMKSKFLIGLLIAFMGMVSLSSCERILEKMWIEKWDGKLPVYGQVPTIFKDISK